MTQKLDKMGIADAVELPRAVWELKRRWIRVTQMEKV